MPDAARLVAAICLGLLAYIVSTQVMEVVEAEKGIQDFGWFVWVNVGIGIAVGWVAMGRRAGRGVTAAVNNGITGIVLLLLWALLIQGINEMVKLAMRNRYDGPFEAIVAVFEIGAEYGTLLLDPVILITLVAGGIATGLLTENAWRRWR